jgi:hypothetical protein
MEEMTEAEKELAALKSVLANNGQLEGIQQKIKEEREAAEARLAAEAAAKAEADKTMAADIVAKLKSNPDVYNMVLDAFEEPKKAKKPAKKAASKPEKPEKTGELHTFKCRNPKCETKTWEAPKRQGRPPTVCPTCKDAGYKPPLHVVEKEEKHRGTFGSGGDPAKKTMKQLEKIAKETKSEKYRTVIENEIKRRTISRSPDSRAKATIVGRTFRRAAGEAKASQHRQAHA